MPPISTSCTIRFVPKVEPTVQFRLIPSATSVRRAPDGTLTPALLTFSVLRTTGDTAETLTHAQALSEGLAVRNLELSHNVPPTGFALATTDNFAAYTFTLFRSTAPTVILDQVSVAVVRDGEPGDPGNPGDPGTPGKTYVPNVAANGDLSWTVRDDDKAPLPSTINIKGPAGTSPEVWRVVVTPTAIGIGADGSPTASYISYKVYRSVGDYEQEIAPSDLVSLGVNCHVGYIKDGVTVDKGYSHGSARHKLADLNPALDADAFCVWLIRTSDSAQLAIATVPVARAGIEGVTIRVTEWSGEGFAYCDGKAVDPSTGLRYLDIASVTANGARTMSVCKLAHTSSEENKPQADSAYWDPMDSQAPIYTPLLLADNARIDFLNGQEIAVYSNTETNGAYPVVGRLGYPSGLVSQDPDLNTAGERSVMWLGETPDSTVYKGAVNIGKNGTVRIGPHKKTHFVIRPDRGSIELRKASSGQTFLSFDGNGVTADDMARAGIEIIESKIDSDTVVKQAASGSSSQTVDIASFRLTQPTRVKVATTVRLVNNGLADVKALVCIKSGSTVIAGAGDFDPVNSPSIASGVNTFIVEGVTIETLPAGTYTFAVAVSMTRVVSSGGSTTSGTASATLYPRAFAITAYDAAETAAYKARYTSNGLIVSNSRSDYCAIWSEGTGTDASLAFEFRNRHNVGLRLGSSGIEVTDEQGIWTPLKDYIARIAFPSN